MTRRARYSLRIPPELRESLQHRAAEKNVPINEWIVRCLQVELDKVDGKPPAPEPPLLSNPLPIVPLNTVRWHKKEGVNIYEAYSWNNRLIGCVDDFVAASHDRWRWYLLYTKPTAMCFTDGDCQTLSGAKQALVRAWNTWVGQMGLRNNPPADGEFITAAAIQHAGRTWSVPIPGRHNDVIKLIAQKAPETIPVGGASAQGFITNTGRFVEREEAGVIALAACQTPALKWGPNLFSEDLW